MCEPEDVVEAFFHLERIRLPARRKIPLDFQGLNRLGGFRKAVRSSANLARWLLLSRQKGHRVIDGRVDLERGGRDHTAFEFLNPKAIALGATRGVLGGGKHGGSPWKEAVPPSGTTPRSQARNRNTCTG